MYKPALAAVFLSASILAGPALAQTAPATAATADANSFVTMQANTDFKASKFVGVDVYGSEGEKIGDISEILIDAQGNAKAVVIGVGGFLGMGQKNVALPWSAMTWSNEPMRVAAADRPATTASTRPPAAGPMTGSPPPATTQAPARSPAEQAAYNGYPDHAKVKLTKAQLKEAPEFKYVADAPGTDKK